MTPAPLRSRSAFALACVLCAIVLPLTAITNTPARAEGELTVQVTSVRDESGRVTAVFTVLDATGRPVARVEPGQLRVRVDGSDIAAASLSGAVSAQIGVAVVLAVDTSGSMAGAPIASARAAGARFLDGLTPQDAAALVAFSDTVTVEQPLTGDRAALRAGIDRLHAAGATALYDAVARSIEVASAAPHSRKAIVLLSDGAQSGASALTRDAVLDRAAARGVVVYVIAYGSAIDQAFLGELASRSGGRLVVAPTTADLGAAYAELSELLRTQHVLVLEPPPSAAPIRTLDLTVTTPAGAGVARATFTNSAPAAVASAPSPSIDGVAPAATGGGAPSLVLLVSLAAALATAGAGWFIVRRRRGRTGTYGAAHPLLAFEARAVRATPPPRGLRLAVLTTIEGPDRGQSVEVRDGVTTVGSSPTASLRLSGAPPQVAPEQLRLWWRDEKLMLHRMDRQAGGAGRSAWSTLRSGDVLDVGPHRISVRIVGAPAAGEPGADHGVEPLGLVRLEPRSIATKQFAHVGEETRDDGSR